MSEKAALREILIDRLINIHHSNIPIDLTPTPPDHHIVLSDYISPYTLQKPQRKCRQVVSAMEGGGVGKGGGGGGGGRDFCEEGGKKGRADAGLRS